MINLKKYKKNTFIIIILSLIIFTFSIVSSILISNYKNDNEVNSLQNINTQYLKFNVSDKITFTNILSILDKYKNSDIYMEFNPVPKYIDTTTFFGKGIYYNYDLNNRFPILEGRNFTLQEINTNEKKILVGKNLKSEIIIENGNEYFVIGDEKFKVIGVLGDVNRETGYDNTFVINLLSSNGFSDSRARWKLNVSNKQDLDEILIAYRNLAKKNSATINIIQKDEKKLSLFDIIHKYPDFTDVLKMVFILGIIDLIIVIYYWINKSIKEIGIKKSYGATDFDISINILMQYIICTIISVFIGILLHSIFKTILIKMFPMFSFCIYYENIIIITLVFMIIGLIISIIPLIKLKKVKPISIMKGSLK